MMQFDVGSDDLLVVPFDLAELLGDVQSEMSWDLDVAPVYHDVHTPSTVVAAATAATHARRRRWTVRGSDRSPTRSGQDNASWEFARVPDGRHA